MKKTYICKNGHKFKSDDTNPVCLTCNEKGEPLEWKKVESFVKKETTKNGLIKNVIDTTITAGLAAGLTGSGESSAEMEGNDSDDLFKGDGGTFGGGGASGSF